MKSFLVLVLLLMSVNSEAETFSMLTQEFFDSFEPVPQSDIDSFREHIRYPECVALIYSEERKVNGPIMRFADGSMAIYRRNGKMKTGAVIGRKSEFFGGYRLELSFSSYPPDTIESFVLETDGDKKSCEGRYCKRLSGKLYTNPEVAFGDDAKSIKSFNVTIIDPCYGKEHGGLFWSVPWFLRLFSPH